MDKKGIMIEELKIFSKNDKRDIERLAGKLNVNSIPLTDEDLKSMLSSPNTHLFIIRELKNKKIIGMITLFVYRIPYTKKSYIDDVVVDEAYRGLGLGSQLMDKALTTAKKMGAKYVDFTSRPQKVDGNKFYQKLGFKKRDTNVYRLTFDYAEE